MINLKYMIFQRKQFLKRIFLVSFQLPRNKMNMTFSKSKTNQKKYIRPILNKMRVNKMSSYIRNEIARSPDYLAA